MDHISPRQAVRAAEQVSPLRHLKVDHGSILADARFAALVRERRRFSWLLTGCMLSAYFAFILAIAFRPQLLAAPVSSGRPMTWGIVIGFAMFAYTFLLVAIYVARANRVHDRAVAALKEDRS